MYHENRGNILNKTIISGLELLWYCLNYVQFRFRVKYWDNLKICHDMTLWYDCMMLYDIKIWFHNMNSYSIIIRWYHNIVLCSRNQAWEAGNFQIGGFSPYETIFTWNFQNRGFLGEPGVGNLRNIPPVALLSKNPYRQSLIGKEGASPIHNGKTTKKWF